LRCLPMLCGEDGDNAPHKLPLLRSQQRTYIPQSGIVRSAVPIGTKSEAAYRAPEPPGRQDRRQRLNSSCLVCVTAQGKPLQRGGRKDILLTSGVV